MTLNQLRYFQAVARALNFRAAAEELYISQPSLSRSIDSLEQELGVMLFERAGRGISLTGSGRLFLEYTNRILDECDIAIYKMKELSSTGGRIDIGYVFPLANYYIPHKVSGKLDVGFCGYSENEEELEFVPILKQEMVIITSNEHPLADIDKLSIKELANYPVIGYDRFSNLGGYTKRLYRNLGIKPDIVCECSDENAIQALVREQFGIALVARVDILNDKYLKIHSVSDVDLIHYVNAVWLKNHYLIPATKRFIDFMIGESNLDPEEIKAII